MFSSHGFLQLIDIPTRITLNCLSLIDLIFVNQPDDVICHGTLPKIADHAGVVVSFNTKNVKPKPKTKIIYDYKNADIEGLMRYIKEYNFENSVFSRPFIEQADIFSNILKQAFAQFIPSKSVVIRPTDQGWCNSFTRLLLRKKNRNYLLYKKCVIDYQKCLGQPNTPHEIVTRLLNRKDKAYKKSREAANDSTTANRRAKASFHNTINDTLRNPSLSEKRNLVYC